MHRLLLHQLEEMVRYLVGNVGLLGDAVAAVRAAYGCEGVNVGLNLGAAGGAGIPGHLHVHVVPRWRGDTNFMTVTATTRVLPEPLDVTWQRVRSAWPQPPS